MSIADFLGEYFESDLIKAHLSGSGIIGSAMGVYSPGTAYVLLHHYMGDVDGSIGAWGFARGGMGAVSKAIASAFKASRRRDRHGRAGRARHRAQRPGRPASRPRTATSTARRSSSRTSIRSAPSPSCSTSRTCDPALRQARAQLQDPRLLGQAQHRARRAAGVPGARARQPAALRRHALPRLAREDGARVRRLEERHLVEGSVPRPADPVDDRSRRWRRPASTSCRCSCSTCRRRSTAATGPMQDRDGFRRHGARPDRALQPEFQAADPPRRGAHAARARERGRPHRGQHLPGRADDGSAALQPAVPGLRAVPRAGEGLLHVRLGHASGRRRHGGAGRQCRARDPARSAPAELVPEGWQDD